MYKYEEQKKELYTESGLKILLSMRDAARKKLADAGAFRADAIFTTGDSWTMLAALDFMVEEGEIQEVTRQCAAQHRVFVGVGV